MVLELFVLVVVIALHSCFFDCSVHAFDLAVGPGMFDFGQPVINAIFLTAHIKHMGEICCRRAIGIARRIGELDAIVGQDGMDFVGNARNQGF